MFATSNHYSTLPAAIDWGTRHKSSNYMQSKGYKNLITYRYGFIVQVHVIGFVVVCHHPHKNCQISRSSSDVAKERKSGAVPL